MSEPIEDQRPAATEGPWWTMPDPSEGFHVVCRVGYGRAIAHVEFSDNSIEGEGAANARLIASAPALRDALTALLEAIQTLPISMHSVEAWDVLDAAQKQAESALGGL